MYSFGAPTFQPEKFHHESLLLLLLLSSITYFVNRKDLEHVISFHDYLYRNFYGSLCGLVLPDDTKRRNRHEIVCAWRQLGGRGLSLPHIFAFYSLSITISELTNEADRATTAITDSIPSHSSSPGVSNHRHCSRETWDAIERAEPESYHVAVLIASRGGIPLVRVRAEHIPSDAT
jgi:hypothetical protein